MQEIEGSQLFCADSFNVDRTWACQMRLLVHTELPNIYKANLFTMYIQVLLAQWGMTVSHQGHTSSVLWQELSANGENDTETKKIHTGMYDCIIK